MKFIFEDFEDDILSLLFKQAYLPESAAKFIYAEGNGNLEFQAKRVLKESEDIIIVYLDTIPCNKATIDVYNRLKELSIHNNHRIIVLNIICAEYYFIKSIYSSNLFINREGLDLCINKEFYMGSTLLKTKKDRNKVKTFEKFCKYILGYNLIDCARTKNRNLDLYPFYYTKDCLCSGSMDNCVSKSLKDKALSYVRQYPCIPLEGLLGTPDKRFKLEDVWELHRSLVNDYNLMTYKFMEAETRKNFIDYEIIEPIK